MKVKFYATLLLCVGVLMLSYRVSAQMKPETIRQIQALLDEKASRTPAQKKVGSQLLQAARESQGQKMAPNTNLDAVQLPTEDGKVKVDINLTQVTDGFLNKIQSLGGKIIYSSKQYNTVKAALPLDAIEKLAADNSVKFIEQAPGYLLSGTGDGKQKSDKTTVNKLRDAKFSDVSKRQTPSLVRRRPTIAERQAHIKQQVEDYVMLLGTGSVNSQGDHAHRADDVRNTYGYAGQGIKIGVLSDSYNALNVANADVLSGDLPGIGNPYGNTTPVTVVADYSGGADEGRAMMQIVHDLVPKAQLFFATADLSEASFAANIVALRNTYNCDIIIDDVYYFDEPAFQDGIVAQAVNTVTAAGAMYFSSAGNSGSLSLGSSGVWEGDFTDVGSPVFIGSTKAGTIHNFGSPIAGDSITKVASGAYNLQWADPWGASSNDYDLFLVNAAGTVKASSTTTQSGLQNPYESFSPPTLVAGDRLIVFKSSTAAVRAISLNTNRGALLRATVGQTHGHACAADAFCVAAAPAAAAFGTGYPTGPYPGIYTSSQLPENFTSDGPRKIFFQPDGTPITPGNFLFATSGGTIRNKPDITAADGVNTTLAAGGGLNPFYGTSAAAPHAGAIAALLKCAAPSYTNAQIRTVLTSTALDILNTGYDITTGYGIVQAYQGIQAINPTPLPYINIGTTTVSEGSFSNGNGSLDPGETGNLVVQLKNLSLVTDPNVTATVTTTTPGITILNGTVSYGNIASGANASNTATPFTFAINSSVACGTTITFQIKATFTGGVGSVGFTTTYTLGLTTLANISSTLGATPPTGSGYTAVTGTFNTARLNRNTPVSSCGSQKATPILTSTVGVRAYDAYTIPNSNAANQCVTVTMTAPNGINLYVVAYNSNGFVPTNPAANFLADQGTSAATQSFSFTDTAGKPFTLVVYNITPGSDVGSAYAITASYTSCAAPKACTPIVITKTSLPAGATGTYYVQHITATGGSGAYLDSLFGTLPAGLSFAGDSLFGTPTQAGTFPISVKVADLVGCSPSTITYSLAITGTLPASITATGGTPQSSFIGTPFATALQATVKSATTNPLPGVNVIFTAPASGASGTFTGGATTATVVTNSSGIAIAPTFTPNTTAGSYTVTAYVTSLADTARFILTNNCISTIVTTNADSGPGSLRYIIANACPNPVITFNPSVTSIILTSGNIPITSAVTITGPGADKLTISGNFNSRIFNISAGTATVAISGMTLRDGKLATTDVTGGGAIFINNGASAGVVNIAGCYIINNDVTASTGFLGGGVDNEGGTVTIDRCTITNNRSVYRAGAVESEGYGSMTITNSTITGNTASATGLGGAIRSFLPLKIINSTIYANSASGGGNISIGGGTDTIMNSIVAGGVILVTGGAGPDVAGALYSGDYNLIGSTSGATVTGTTTHNIVTTNPKLLPLANYGGVMPTILPMSNSPVVNAGDPTLLAIATDQRGFSRKVGTSADIGSIETNYLASIVAGTPQSTAINTAFAIALQAKVTESGNNIAGDSVLFGAPASGASGTFASGLKTITAVTNASGVATASTFTANNAPGSYNDTASIGSTFTSLKYALTNVYTPPIAFTGCPNVNLVIARPGFNLYNGEPLSIYNLDTATGAATLLPGGPLKDSLTNKNFEVNGAGVNGQDGFIYAMRDTVVVTSGVSGPSATMFYRIGTNYSNSLLGTLPAPPSALAINTENLSEVIPAAGCFDDQGNYYYIGVIGTYSFISNTLVFTPSSYFVGKVANVASLGLGTAPLTVTWTKINFSGAPAAYVTSITSLISSVNGFGAGTSFQDVTYSNMFKSLYVYSTYTSANSTLGLLFSINPTTGVATFYPSATPTSGEVAGISTTASGSLRVFTTTGDVYRSVMAGNGDFTGTFTKIGGSGIAPAGVPGSIRGDLASCNVGPSTPPLPGSIVVGQPNQIIAYPNPAQGLTTITVGQSLTNATVRLYGSAGNVILEKSGVSGLTFQMDMTGKASGMYMVEVIQGGNTQTVKVIKD